MLNGTKGTSWSRKIICLQISKEKEQKIVSQSKGIAFLVYKEHTKIK